MGRNIVLNNIKNLEVSKRMLRDIFVLIVGALLGLVIFAGFTSNQAFANTSGEGFVLISAQSETWGTIAIYADISTEVGYAVLIDTTGNAVSMVGLTDETGRPLLFQMD